MSSRSAELTYRSGASGGTVWRAWAKRCPRPVGAMSVPAADTAPDSSIAEESASRLCAVSCRHEPPRPHQRAQGACGARRPGLQARARPAPRQPPPAPAGSPIRPEHDSTRRWSPRRLPSSAPGALRCPWHRSMSGSRRSPAPPPPSPPARPARRPRSGAPQRPNLTVIVAAGGRAVLKFGAGCAATVRARGQLIGEEGGGWEQPGPEYSGACYFLGRSSTAGIGGPADPRINCRNRLPHACKPSWRGHSTFDVPLPED